MVTETPNLVVGDSLLLEMAPQPDLFVCDIADAVLKDLHPQMEHPFYSLSKKPEREVRRYSHGGQWIEVRPSTKGAATIYDKDILIFAISNIIAAINRGEEPSKTVRINSYDYLDFTRRGHGGRDYDALVDSLDRLDGTRFATNITTGNEEQRKTFGLVENTFVRRQLDKDGHPTGRIISVEITLSDWVFNAVKHKEVLTLSPDYFKLRKPLERRVYELARKHCGNQRSWRCSIEILHHKAGSQGPVKQFKYLLKQLAATDHLPDYHTEIENDHVVFRSRGTVPEITDAVVIAPLNPEVYERARKAAPGWDIHTIEREWRTWAGEKPHNPETAFLGFCRAWFEKGAAIAAARGFIGRR